MLRLSLLADFQKIEAVSGQILKKEQYHRYMYKHTCMPAVQDLTELLKKTIELHQ